MHAQVATAPALELLKNVILQVLMYIQCMSGNTQAGRSTGHRSSRGFQVQSNLTLHTCLEGSTCLILNSIHSTLTWHRQLAQCEHDPSTFQDKTVSDMRKPMLSCQQQLINSTPQPPNMPGAPHTAHHREGQWEKTTEKPMHLSHTGRLMQFIDWTHPVFPLVTFLLLTFPQEHLRPRTDTPCTLTQGITLSAQSLLCTSQRFLKQKRQNRRQKISQSLNTLALAHWCAPIHLLAGILQLHL